MTAQRFWKPVDLQLKERTRSSRVRRRHLRGRSIPSVDYPAAMADGLVDWTARACDRVIAACDKIAATASSLSEETQAFREYAVAFREHAEAARNPRNGPTSIPDDWEQVPDHHAEAARNPRNGQTQISDDWEQVPDQKVAAAAHGRSSCVICMEPYEAGGDGRSVLSACGHMFHSGCVSTWLRKNRTCPLCVATTEKSASPAAARRAH